MGKPVLDLATLTVEEKLELIDDLWRSISADDLPLSAELDRRLERFEREGSIGTDWEDVLAEMTIGEP
jgi:putative addiction module component (TIGR02574 family)